MRLNRNGVKYLAMAAMVCDHAALFLFAEWTDVYHVLRSIGRISYPLFLALFVEGFFSIKEERYLTHLRNLCLVALLSEPVFNQMLSGQWFVLEFQNVMFSWILLFLLFVGFTYTSRHLQMMNRTSTWDKTIELLFLLSCGMTLGWLFRVDYSWYGILGGGLAYFYFAYGRSTHRKGCAWFAVLPLCLLLSLLSGYWTTMLAVPILLWYDSEQSCCRSKYLKYGMYLFYPVHLWLLYLVHTVWYPVRLLAG